MNLEERVERLEGFIGNIEKITSVYANSLQQICDKYLSLLYIEVPLENHPEILNIDGFLADVSSVANIPHNVVFNIRPSHNFATRSGSGGDISKIRFKKEDTYLELPLKKYDIEHPGNLVYLSPNDYRQGSLYSIYVDSQNIAIITSNDAGDAALSQVQALATNVSNLQSVLSGITGSSGIEASNATIENLTVSQALALTNPVALPTNSTCPTVSAGDSSSKIANTAFVSNAISAAIAEYHRTYHIIDNVAPETALANAPEKAIYYRY